VKPKSARDAAELHRFSAVGRSGHSVNCVNLEGTPYPC
jgi:hypothetical protein